jgi:hypothetical protein
MPKFAQLNCLATLAALVIFAVCIASSIVDWYAFSEEFKASSGSATSTTGGVTEVAINSTKINWSFEGVTRRTKPTGGVETNTFAAHDSSTAVWSTFKLMQAFILIALIVAGILTIFLVVCFACAIRNQLLFMLGMNVLRIALLAIATLILVSLVISFLGFLGITAAFNDDNANCQAGYCRRFQDSTKETLAPQTVAGLTGPQDITVQRTYGPVEGWFLTLACIPVAIILTIIVVINKFPIPVDSVTIGEAL